MARYVVEYIAHQRQDIMVWGRADIYHVVGAFETFVARGIPEQAIGAFDDRQYLLARRRRVAADNVFDAGVTDEVVADGVILCDDTAGVADMGGEGEIKIGVVVDFVDRHQGAFEHFATHRLIGPGLRAYNTNWNRRLRHL